MSRQDPKQYYALLGVSPNAPASDIKTAFRQLAKQFHPDHNHSPNAAHKFQRLNEAYEILINPETRACYDASGIEIPQNEAQRVQTSREEFIEPLEPLVCSMCQEVTAQPRYVIFYNVKSFLVVTIRTPVQGIFCRSCADEKAFRSTVITWLLGWWGFPWGLVYSTHAIINNLLGGSKPKDVNARLLSYQAYVFATQGKYDLARAVGADALDLSHKLDSGIASNVKRIFGRRPSSESTRLQIILVSLLKTLENGKPINRLQGNWVLLSRSFYVQLALIVTAFTIAFNFVPLNSENSMQTSSNRKIHSKSSSSLKPAYVRPGLADNGTPFPINSGYVDSYPYMLVDGYSKITIDNTRNNFDVFIKLFSLDDDKSQPVRVVFIRAKERFTMEKMRAGNYDVRYRNLNTGVLARSEPLQLQEFTTTTGVSFSDVTLTLYKMRNGNAQTYTISESEF
jgi:DnaJ-domain-containing protein 1